MALHRFLLGFVMGLVMMPAGLRAAEYQIDPDHSAVTFKVKHLLSWVHGTFNDFQGSFSFEPGQPQSWQTQARIDAASIDTRNEDRDNHLRNEDFLDVTKYPEISFRSTEITDFDGDQAKLHGVLSLHGVEKPVVLDLTIHGIAEDPWGNVQAGFTATTVIDRKEFGINWNQVLDSGGVLVGNEVHVTLDIQGIKQ